MDQAQIDELLKTITELRDEVRALRAAQQLHVHHHYYPQPVYVPPYNTTTPRFEITCDSRLLNAPQSWNVPTYRLPND